jgi:undecaprenyl-diphosphatase
MSLLNVIILAVVQGFAELLPISSSAHVVVAEKLLGLDPSSPPMTLLLVMLHTGTMLAVIVYFWPQWRRTYFQSAGTFKAIAACVIVATVLTAVVGEAIIKIIEKTLLRAVPHSEIEDLFSHLEFIAPALAVAGFLILWAGFMERRRAARNDLGTDEITTRRAALIGMVQGLCLPFRGFSRSGATISAGMLLGIAKSRAEAFSFALAVVITPPVVARELMRLMRAPHVDGAIGSVALLTLVGAAVAFVAGLFALKWLSRWLESGHWARFGIYCLFAAAAVAYLHRAGY